MVLVPLAQFLDGLFNVLQTVLLSHGLGAEVGVAAGTIPVPGNGLGIKGRDHSEVFTHSMQDETGHPEMISHFNSFTGSYLEFPLGGHDLGVCPRDLDAGVQAGPVVSLHDIPAIGFVCSHATVVWTLRSREAVGRPTKRVPVCAYESIFLLHSKPGVVIAHHVHYAFTGMP